MAHPQVLEAPTLSAQNDEQDANRHLANYHPSIWGDFFLSYASHDSMMKSLKFSSRTKIGGISETTMVTLTCFTSLFNLDYFDNMVIKSLAMCSKSSRTAMAASRLHFHLDSSSMAAHDQFSSSNPLAEQARRALDRPIRKSLIRPEARHYMSVYQEDPLHNEVVLAFAKLDFNILQKLHQKELSDITQWWKSLNISQKLPFVRDRVVELYFWVIGVYFEPEHSMARRILTKVISMISIIDDIYDSYGTIQELELFTVAIERWDISATDQLPEYMKVSYEAVLDVYNEIEIYLANEGKLYRLHYAKEMMKTLVRVYFVEAQWCERKYVPTMEEYMAVALLSCGYTTLASSSFVGMGDIATEDAFDWVSSNPKIIKASSIINRLMDDIVSHEFEQKRGHVASAVECYIKEHGVSEEEVAKLFREQVENAWKDMNEELLKPTVVSAPLLELVLNLARVMDLLYKKDDCYTNSYLMKDHVASLLRDPVLL
ncbi:hypothetical protein ACOSQ4_021669 [Xanthoceras sorbifolium]